MRPNLIPRLRENRSKNIKEKALKLIYFQITKIRWTWEKVGLFQSFAEIEQLNAMVEPQNLA